MSSEPAVFGLPLCHDDLLFFLAEIEVQDIIHVIEGIRYGLPQNEIAELLTIINYRKSGGD